jgi:hypothetical protein
MAASSAAASRCAVSSHMEGSGPHDGPAFGAVRDGRAAGSSSDTSSRRPSRCAGMIGLWLAAAAAAATPSLVAGAGSSSCKTQECCKAQCAAAGYCCNTDLHTSGNHLLSCFQACAMRVAGDTAQTVLDRCDASGQCGAADQPACKLGFSEGGCQLNHPALGTFVLCSDCSDTGDPPPATCGNQVPSKDVCKAGAALVFGGGSSRWGLVVCLVLLALACFEVGVGLVRGSSGGGIRGHPHYRAFQNVHGLVCDGVTFVRTGVVGGGGRRGGGTAPLHPAKRSSRSREGDEGGGGCEAGGRRSAGEKQQHKKRGGKSKRRTEKGTGNDPRSKSPELPPPPAPERSAPSHGFRGDEWAPPKAVLASGARETGVKVTM